jgi:signal transduction histidine kinase/ligand-binding sensor domain-containing protein
MWTLFRKYEWLASYSLILALVSEVCGAAAPSALHAAPNFHHTAWTSANGLGAVFDIQQSSDGYLWLTTSRGVLRFDGVRFQTVAEATYGAVDTNEIDSVFLPSSGGLWLSTTSAGLLFWKDGRLTAFPDRRCTPTRKMGRLVEDRDGSLWVQGAAGLFHLRGSVCEQAGDKQGYPGGFAAGILMDGKGTLWVKTRSGPLLFMPRGQSKFQVSQYGEGVSTSYAFLHEAPDGTIWLSDNQGLRRVEGKPGIPAFSPPPGKRSKRNSQFGDFTFAASGSLWAVTAKGVQRFDCVEQWTTPQAMETAPGEIYTPKEGLSSDAAWKVLIDREGAAWVATNSGLDRLRRNVLSKQALPLAQEREFSIAAGDRGSIWTGNSSLPLTRIAAGGTITSFPKTRETICVRRDRNGTIWSAGAGDFYLWRSSGEGFLPLHYPEENLDAVVSVAVDRHNDPWITTRSGRAYHFVNGTWSNQNKALGKKPGVIGAMADDQAGNVWFAFSDKVVQWDGSAYHPFVRKARDVSQTTMSVRGDRVWLGGPGGVQLFTQGRFYTMKWKDQDLPGRVSGVVETKTGDLWVNGFSGIAHVSAAELKKWLRDPGSAVSAEHFDELDGLPGLSGEKIPEPSVVEASDGRLWFATTKGIAWLDPTALEKNRNRLPPTVVVSAIISNGKMYPGGSSLTLPEYTENVEIDYTALSLAIPERVLFRYKLDGVDSDWQKAGTRRQAFYTKLRPGQYKFRVVACNNDGVWNEAGALLTLTLSPAWFQTSWFLLLCVACSIVLVSLLYRLRVRHIAAAINARFDDRLAERTRIAQELHDTLLQGFLSASMQVHVAVDCLPPDSQVKPILSRALHLMSQVIEEGRNAVRGLRSSHSVSLDLEQAIARIQEEFDPENTNGTQAGFRVIVEGQQRPLRPLLRDEVYRIIREALINAFRHAHANQIEVTLTYTPKQLRVGVCDNGCGIDSETLRMGRAGHWGLSGMRERADSIGARLHVVSRAGAGTEVELSVPGRVAFEDPPRDTLRWFRKTDLGSLERRRDDPVDVPSAPRP